MQESADSSVKTLAPKEVARHYDTYILNNTSCQWLLKKLENSGLDLEKVAQEYSKLKPPNIRPGNRDFTVTVLRFIYYDDKSFSFKWILYISGMMKYLPWSNAKEEEKELKLEIKEEEEEEEDEEEEEGEEGEEEYEYDPEDFVFESDEDLYIDEAFALQYRNNRNNSGYKEMPEVEYEYGVEYDDDKEEFKEDDIDFQYLR